jgi:ribose transport system substrate-binding protein
MQHAIARATGGEVPADDVYPSTAFEDSVSGTPNPVTCEPDLPGDIYLSAEMEGADQAAVIE